MDPFHREGSEERPERLPFRSREEMRTILERALSGETGGAAHVDVEAVLREAGVEAPPEGPMWLHEFAFAAAPGTVPGARRRVAEFAADCGLSGEDLYDMELAAAEGLSNAVRHGSPGGADDVVRVRVGIVGESVVVEVADRGPGFDPDHTVRAGRHDTGGRGVQFMRRLVDDVRFVISPLGTTVLLTKRR